jgi:hypothetical protein
MMSAPRWRIFRMVLLMQKADAKCNSALMLGSLMSSILESMNPPLLDIQAFASAGSSPPEQKETPQKADQKDSPMV